MKTNLFKVKERRERRIIIEEERTKNPFLLFFKKYKNFILTSGIMIALCFILASTGIAFSLFRGSNDYDITYIEGDETISTNKDPTIDEEDIKDELLGEIARESGIVLQTKTFMSSQGDVISYFTDGTSIIVSVDGKIYRLSSNSNGKHGIDKNGKIDSSSVKIRVTATTSTLDDGTIVTYYSDGTAKVEHQMQTYFVRDSNNIKMSAGKLDVLVPSGVAPTNETKKISEITLKKFTNNNYLLIKNNQKIIVNKNTSVAENENDIEYSTQNSFSVIEEKNLSDGYTISYFANGSAIITDKEGNITYVKKSGDIVATKPPQKLYEILHNPIGESYSRTTLAIANGEKVTYFDNAAAVLINNDGSREYIDDNEEIIYDNNMKITNIPSSHKQISVGIIESGETAYNFSNGKSQVIKKNGKSYLVDTETLNFIKEEKPEEESEEKPTHDNPLENPGEGIYISEAENVYNDFKNVENTKFIIKNNNKKSKTLRITIEETLDYIKYNTKRLEPKFVKFHATIGDYYVPETTLTKNTWKDEEERINYVIYDGTIKARETIQVALSLSVNYEPLTNEHQNSAFIGTIRIYVEDEAEE